MRIRFSCPPELFDMLPPPIAAKRGFPDWLKAMPMTEKLADGGEDRTVKQCPPFIDAMGHGFLLPLATDIRVADGRFEWDWASAESPLGFHFASQFPGAPFAPGARSALKFHNFWSIATEPGWAMLFTHPFNRADLPFRTLTGLVDTDHYSVHPVHFPAIWVDTGFAGTLARGTPIAQCFPVRRETLDAAIEPMTADVAAERLRLRDRIVSEAGVYKTEFRQDRS
ncbi:MAG: hypothetical protein FJX57_24790 [Alphaproteobacteria bacterium]|nr:hypothetical protein [Alphaproteobacteria bacterium]